MLDRNFAIKLFLFSILLILVSGGLSCHSAEFFPARDYINLRRSGIKKARILWLRPKNAYQRVGRLIFRDYAGGIRESGFLDLVSQEAARRGAEYAWIKRVRFKNKARYNTYNTARRLPNQRSQNRRSTGHLSSRLRIVEVVLINFIRPSVDKISK